jgi:reverse transcriptase-like protein
VSRIPTCAVSNGDVVIVRWADDFMVGFEHRGDAEQFLVDLRERFAKFALELQAEKTRLIMFGRLAAQQREERGLGRPETFDFLGFTHACGKTRSGRFMLKRVTISKRMRAKLREVKDQLKRRRHLPIPEQGQWLGSVVRGHLAYYAVPGNTDAVAAFRAQVTWHWYRALRRRSQRTSLNWGLDHLLIVGRRHLEYVLEEFIEHYPGGTATPGPGLADAERPARGDAAGGGPNRAARSPGWSDPRIRPSRRVTGTRVS